MAKKPAPAPQTKKTFLAFVTDDESHATLLSFAASQGWDESCIQRGTPDDAAEYLSLNFTPDFLLVDIASAEDAPDALDKLADVCDPNVKVIVTSTVDEYSFFRWLTEIGIHYYLLKPLTETNLQAALKSHAGPEGAAEKEKKTAKLIAVIGTRGGVGASAIALNLAAELANQHHLNTALLDLEPQWGTLSLMLDLEPGRGLREALAQPDRIDMLFLERVMMKYSENLSILSSEESFDDPVSVHDDAATALLREVQIKFAVAVADLPRDLGHFTETVLNAANHVIVVTELTLISLRDAMRLQDYLKTKLGIKHIHFVANKQGMLPKLEMSPADFEKTLGVKLRAVIPFDAEAYEKMASGGLAVDKKSSTPMAVALAELAKTFHRVQETNTPAATAPKWLKWLKGKH